MRTAGGGGVGDGGGGRGKEEDEVAVQEITAVRFKSFEITVRIRAKRNNKK